MRLNPWFSSVRVVGLACVLAVSACGGDDDEAEGRKPDTGYGAGLPVPATRTCADICPRLADCAAALCNEDTDSNRYDALRELLAGECDATCSDALVSSEFTDEQWSCLFQSSCREVFDYDECRADGSYYCR